MIRTVLLAILLPAAAAAGPDAPFASIDGGEIRLADLPGPVLLVNTASLCAFTPQYEALQDLHDAYAPQGVTVLAIPSDSFRQELESAEEVADFCQVNYDLTLPMTDITPVRGEGAHPVYAWIEDETGFAPAWNFNKVLVADGAVLGTWGSSTRPGSRPIRRAIEAALAAG